MNYAGSLTTALLVPVLGLGRIFDVSSSESSSPRSSSPVSYKGIADKDGDAFFAFEHLVDASDGDNLELAECPKCVDVVEVEGLTSATTMEAILAAEGQRGRTEWLVVYVRGSTTVLLFPPRETRAHNLTRCGLTVCMEWLEEAGVSQILIAVPNASGSEEEVALCKNLLFLGFSRLPKEVVANQLPRWLTRYNLLVTDFTEV